VSRPWRFVVKSTARRIGRLPSQHTQVDVTCARKVRLWHGLEWVREAGVGSSFDAYGMISARDARHSLQVSTAQAS